MKVYKKKQYFCAHRGLNNHFPENTIPAFVGAAKLNAPEIEFDIHGTADKKLIICHDSTVDRVSNGSGAIKEMTFDQIRSLNAGEYKGFDNIAFPTPDEVFATLGNSVGYNLHLKEVGEDNFILKGMLELIDKHNLKECAYISGHVEVMSNCYEIAPDYNRCVLEQNHELDIIDRAIKYHASRVQLNYFNFKEYLVKKGQDAGIILNMFHAGDPKQEDYENTLKFLDMDIDCILTNCYDEMMTLYAGYLAE